VANVVTVSQMTDADVEALKDINNFFKEILSR